MEELNKIDILKQLYEAVSTSDKDKGKIHQVFERSFDCKEITSKHFFMQKLSYIHNNPCSGVWKLTEKPMITYTAQQNSMRKENREFILLQINDDAEIF